MCVYNYFIMNCNGFFLMVFHRERKSKIDDGILQLKNDILTENLLKCTNELSDVQSRYHKEVNEFKPELDKMEAEVK